MQLLYNIKRKIFVKVKPGSKIEKIKKIDDKNFEVWVKEPAKQGKANSRLLKVLADYFKIPLSKVKIVAGHTSKKKIIEINE